MQGQLTCPKCLQDYDNQNLPRLLTMCGHTYCQTCITGMINQQSKHKYKVICPDDGAHTILKNKSLNSFPKNIALVKMIDNKKNNSFKDSSFDVSKIAKQQQVLQEDEQTSELITAIKEGQNSQHLDKNNTNMCLLHQKPLEVVCMIDLEKICSKCAIFGQHKGHEFKSLEEIDRQTNEYYNSIIKIFEQKDIIVSRISNQETENQIMSILSNNKSRLKKQISEKYKKLIQNIKLSEKQSLHRLDQTIESTNKNLKKLLSINESTMNKYSQWQQESFQIIQKVQGGNFQEKLQLVFLKHKKNPEATLLQTGNELIQSMIQQQQNLVSDVEVLIKNIAVQFDHQVIDSISQFCTIYQDGKPESFEEYSDNQEIYRQNPKKININNPHEQSLLENDTDIGKKNKNYNFDSHQKRNNKMNFQEPRISIINNLKSNEENFKSMMPKSPEKDLYNYNNIRSDKSPQQSFMSDKNDRLSKKKLKSLKVPEKYQKVLDNIYNDVLDVIDFTNAELGNTLILQICEFIRGTKAKNVKFIRNKLTDDAISKMIPNLGNVITLNLSQNQLTENSIDIFTNYREMLPNLKSIILSQNKIIERKHKIKIDKLRKMDLTVSI